MLVAFFYPLHTHFQLQHVLVDVNFRNKSPRLLLGILVHLFLMPLGNLITERRAFYEVTYFNSNSVTI